MSNAGEYELDDEFEYHAYRVGRPTRTVEIDAPGGGAHTIEEGTLTAELVHREDLWETRESGGWTAHYAGPDGGIGFGIGEENSGGVVVPYDLVGVIEFPEPMTEKEADEWLDDEKLLKFRDESLESDLTADQFLEEIR
jgi:hypothetical protein